MFSDASSRQRFPRRSFLLIHSAHPADKVFRLEQAARKDVVLVELHGPPAGIVIEQREGEKGLLLPIGAGEHLVQGENHRNQPSAPLCES